jgi:hypothetical protein
MMETFEVHITGDESIMAAAKDLGVKAIAVELLRPDKSVIRTEFMTSIVMKELNYVEVKKKVDELVNQLKERKVTIVRTKIESPFYEHYVEQSLYLESHFLVSPDRPAVLPISRSRHKPDKFLGTLREYTKADYHILKEVAEIFGDEVELCLYDDNIDEDKDWLSLWGDQKSL